MEVFMTSELVNLNFENYNVRTVVLNGTPFWVGVDVCRVLGYANANDAMSLHCKSYRDDLAKRYSILDRLGRKQETIILPEADVLRLIVSCQLPAAEKFERWIFEEVLPSIRKTGSYISPSQQVERLELENKIIRQKLRLFEEYNEDILYDFSQVASAMRIYRRPPFGESHLKKWLADHKIICLPFHKNDKPIQRYIEKDWFRLVMHEWKRNQIRRYEPRYLITQRGFNSMIDLAIREKVIELPLPKQDCLPHLFDEIIPPEAGGNITVSDYNGNDAEIS
jgi:prophage antirepressor-like protein